eukprot:GHVH01008770.1.p1 GENE.GHVH01008770.1~~GHVH01008770.1.p1  ORF type:complete len:197 (-),score=15.60 GHVH01008770.1:74-664(-)
MPLDENGTTTDYADDCSDDVHYWGSSVSVCEVLVDLCDWSEEVQTHCKFTCGQCSEEGQDAELDLCKASFPSDSGNALFCGWLCKVALNGDFTTCSNDLGIAASKCIAATFTGLCPMDGISTNSLASDRTSIASQRDALCVWIFSLFFLVVWSAIRSKLSSPSRCESNVLQPVVHTPSSATCWGDDGVEFDPRAFE